MLTACQRRLASDFQHHLPFTPTASQVDAFEADLLVLHPRLVEDALKEAANGKGLFARPGGRAREVVLSIYFRKLAEQTNLFPFMHMFENALRSTIAARLEDYYGTSKWWMPVRDALRAGRDSSAVSVVGKRTLARDAGRLMAHIVSQIESRPGYVPVSAFVDGYDFTEACDLSHLGRLVLEHWRAFEPYFSRRITKSEFAGLFTRVHLARNDLYHHRRVSHTATVLTAIETMLDLMNVSAIDVQTSIDSVRLPAPNFTIRSRPGRFP